MHSNQHHKLILKPKLIKSKKYRWRNDFKSSDYNFRSQAPHEKEDWENEIALCTTEENKNNTTYDSEDELDTTETDLCDVKNSASSDQNNYSPVVHHTHPVKWVRCIYTIVADQFADADE